MGVDSLTWSQIRAATLPTPADSPQATQATAFILPTAQSGGQTGGDSRNPDSLTGLRNKKSNSYLAPRAKATTNETLFRALRSEFPRAKVQALAIDERIVDPTHDTKNASAQAVTTAQVRKIAAFLDAAGEFEATGSTDARVRAFTLLQAQARRKLLNSHIAREDMGHGIERIRIRGDTDLFGKLGIPLDPARNNREIDVIKIPADKAHMFLAGKGKMMNPMIEGERTFFEFLSSAMMGEKAPVIVWGNGAFFNMGGGADPTLPEETPIGQTRYANKPVAEAEVIEPPAQYEKYYVTVERPGMCKASYAPLLSLLGEEQYTKEMLADPRFYATEITPGELTHARRPNPRRADVFPSRTVNDPANAIVNNIYLIAGISHARGDESNGFTIDEWSSVGARFDRMNTHRGFTVNADGGSSVMIGINDPRASRMKVSTDVEGRTIANVVGIGVVENAGLPVLGSVDKDELLTLVHRAVLHGIQRPLKDALAEEVANMVALQFGLSTNGEDTLFNKVVLASIERLRADRGVLEGHYSRVWKHATLNGLAPFLDEDRQAELGRLLEGDPKRSSLEAWIGQTLSIDAERLIDSALKLSTDNIVLQLTTEEMKSYFRRFTSEFRGSFTLS
jgi:hypothetical protein